MGGGAQTGGVSGLISAQEARSAKNELLFRAKKIHLISEREARSANLWADFSLIKLPGR